MADIDTSSASAPHQPTRRVAFLGLGVMGDPMAGHLARAGHDVTVYNRTAAKADAWVARHGGRAAPTPAAAAEGADIVFACVGNDDDLRSVVCGEHGAFAGMQRGAVFVDHTTASAQIARELSGLAVERGLQFVDAPVSGGNLGAVNGTLSVMCGGDSAAFAKVQAVMTAYAKAVTLVGAAGAGQLTKMVNQIALVGVVQGLAEALAFGQQAGLDMQAVVAAISKGAAQSWQMDNRAATMLRGEFDFGFAVDWMRKDLGLVLDEARRNGAQLPVAAVIDQFFADVQAAGGNRQDVTSLLQRLQPGAAGIARTAGKA